MNVHDELYAVMQPALNLCVGFVWGLHLVRTNRVFMNPLNLLWTLIVFVSVRIFGDVLFRQSEPYLEPLRLVVYAFSFFFGTLISRWVRDLYGANAH
jgi:hypothetical protein